MANIKEMIKKGSSREKRFQVYYYENEEDYVNRVGESYGIVTDLESAIYSATDIRDKYYYVFVEDIITKEKVWDSYGGKFRRSSSVAQPKHYPMPDYPYCNKGHRLVEVYDERRNAFVWDCPICIKRMTQ